ncbi:MAG: hypothetical protein ACOYM5_08825 [Caulobacter sp.]
MGDQRRGGGGVRVLSADPTVRADLAAAEDEGLHFEEQREILGG